MVVNAGKEKSQQSGKRGSAVLGPRAKHVRIGHPETGKNKASQTHLLLYILLTEQYTAADVSNKETEKQRNA